MMSITSGIQLPSLVVRVVADSENLRRGLTEVARTSTRNIDNINKDLNREMQKSTRNTIDNVERTSKVASDEMYQVAKSGADNAQKMYKEIDTEMQNTAKSTISNTEKISQSLTSMGSKLTKALTVPITGASVAIGKMAMSYEKNIAKVSTLVDESTYNYNQLSKDIIDGSNKMKVAVDEYSEAVYQSISAGVEQKKAVDFTNNSIKLAKGGFTDASKAVDVLTTILNAYSLSVDEANRVSDLLVNTQNLGKVTVDELASSMGKVIPTANSVSVDIDNVCTALAQLTKNGIATAEATTYYNSMLNELGKSGTTADEVLRNLSGKGFKALIDEGKPLTEILKMLDNAAKKNGKSLSDMFGSAEASKAALTLMKNNGTEYNEILEKMKNSAGATEEAFKKIDSTTSEQLAGAWNELKNAGIELGASLLPIVKEGVVLVKDLVDKFNGLSDSQKKNILQMGLWLACLGPVLSIGGKVIGVVGNIAGAFKTVSASATVATGVSSMTKSTGIAGLVSKLGALSSVSVLPVVAGIGTVGASIYALNKRNEYLNTSLATTEEELPLIQKCFNKLNGNVIKSRAEMEELGLIHKKWSEDISQEVAESLDNTAEQFRNLNFEIDRLNENDIVIDDTKANELKNKTKEICNSIIDEIKSKSSEAHDSFNEYFKADGNIDTYEQQILSYFKGNSEYRIQLVQTYEDKINKIYDKANKQKRELYESEVAIVKDYEEKIAQIKIEVATNSNAEYQEAQANFLAKMEELDLEGASNLMQEKANLRDEEISQIKEAYNTRINELTLNLNNMNTVQRIAAETEIKRLENEKEQKIKIQEDTYNTYLKVIEENYPEIYNRIEFWSGKTLTVSDKEAYDALMKAQEHYANLEQITETGMHRVYNTQTKTYDTMYVKIDEATGKVLGLWNKSNDEIAGCTEDMRDEIYNVAHSYEEMTEESRQNLINLVKANTNYTVQMSAGAKAVVNNLEDITKTSDGTYQGILKINNNPIDVTVNKDGAISNLKDIIKMMNNIPSIIHTRVETSYIDINGKSFNSSRYTSDGRRGYYYPGHYNGLKSVPYDGYTARLHKDERVLTAEENAEYTANKVYGTREKSEITINSYVNLDGKIVGKSVDKVNGASMDLERRQLGLC